MVMTEHRYADEFLGRIVSYQLVGPYVFDIKTVVACGRAALAHVGEALRTGNVAELIDQAVTGTDPGLYVCLEHDGDDDYSIAGFWIVQSVDYLALGPAGPPDRVPPFVQDLLDAATEEVWWQSLKVSLAADGSWRPVVLLEWPSYLANRSAAAPPGVPFDDPGAEFHGGSERETWLESVDGAQVAPAQSDIPSGDFEKEYDHYAGVPDARSVIVLARGTLTHDGRLHRGSFFMVPPELFDDGTTSPKPLEEWMDEAREFIAEDMEAVDRDEEQGHKLGRPLQLPGGRVGFHASGWLTKGLGIWPARPDDVAIGYLTDRVVQQKWISQARLAAASSLLVLTTVLSFTAGVRWLSEPTPEEIAPPPAPAAQPSMSVCSAEYQEFVDEFRCQIAHLASAGDNYDVGPVCGDKGATSRWEDDGRDLQAEFCALVARGEEDKWIAGLTPSVNSSFADFAASQACFNVLGHPQPYTLVRSGEARRLGRPSSFIEDPELGIQPLIQLRQELLESCEVYRERTDSMVAGGIFATHVGGPMARSPENDSGAGALRREIASKALVGATADTRTCFHRGMEAGFDAARYEGMCLDTAEVVDPDRMDVKAARSKMWVKLGGEPGVGDRRSVIRRYADARFNTDRNDVKVDDLWQCHLGLESGKGFDVGRPVGSWDIAIPVPEAYDIRGKGARTQLTLDAVTSSESEAGICWSVLRQRLESSYQEVHPLLGDLEPDGWPSAEQQLCGQICASRFNVKLGINHEAWITREEDLAQCVSGTEPRTDSAGRGERIGAGRLDKLRLPWSYRRRDDWTPPMQSQVCAFNLVAQNLMPEIEGGYTVAALEGKEFAGETEKGSRIAGGMDGQAARYVEGLSFGRLSAIKSQEACANVATQCYSSLMLEITGNEDIERYRWREAWTEKVEEVAKMRRSEMLDSNPWCVGIRDYMDAGREPAQLDTTCYVGIMEARKKTIEAIEYLQTEVVASNGGE